jgi:hypothetical protein
MAIVRDAVRSPFRNFISAFNGERRPNISDVQVDLAPDRLKLPGVLSNLLRDAHINSRRLNRHCLRRQRMR